ncbi:MAG: metal ABC transporter permease [Candidatus Magasanikbacteria bacterium]|nr:metal ABC transporter permease [Candidatus Magasanikbacteria bacterium]
MFDIFHYSFVLRGLEAGMLIALIAPLIGIFLVLRRYALIADTLSHVSLAGVAIGLIAGINPLITAIVASTVASVAIERLRLTKRVYGETALALFLSGSLAVAIVLIGLAHGFNADLFSYLFGSIVTVKQTDLVIIALFSLIILAVIPAFYKELVYISFDEEAARVSGLPTNFINTLFIIIASVTVALAIPIIGVLLISALIVIPVVTALQLKKNFWQTILWAQAISVASVLLGIVISFYENLSPGGTIVLIMLVIFTLVFLTHRGAALERLPTFLTRSRAGSARE